MTTPQIARALEKIAQCESADELRKWIASGRRESCPEVERAARIRLYEVSPSAQPGTLEYDVWQGIFALEDLESAKRGKTIRLSRTRTMIKNRGEVATIAHLVSSKAPSAGFHMLLEYGLPELLFEALVLRHPASFSKEVIEAAKQRLEEFSVAIFAS